MADKTLYDTLTQPISSESSGLHGGGTIGFSFNSDDIGSGLLTDVKVSLSDTTPADGGEVLVRLFATDQAGGIASPTTQIANLGVISDAQLSLSTSPSDVPVTVPVTLAPGTQYMIELTGILGSNATLSLQSGDTGIGTHMESTYYSNASTTENDLFFGSAIAQVTENVTCFASGTLIRTSRGDVAVEALAVGDLAVTASGAHRAIK